jgi:hypothetical protein
MLIQTNKRLVDFSGKIWNDLQQGGGSATPQATTKPTTTSTKRKEPVYKGLDSNGNPIFE